jgi:wyosine [tRNA(Phe)-imidazoG37] synthetase (radical SAM superfamily)
MDASVRVVSRGAGPATEIEVNLTPNGACPFACDYCEFRPRSAARAFPEPVEIRRLEGEVRAALEAHGTHVGAIVFTGPGEPTWSPQFEQALTIVLACVRCLSRRPVPVRVLTCGAMLERVNVVRALEELVRAGEGEVWVKLDAWDEDSFQAYNGGRAFDRSLQRIAAFARSVPIVLRTTAVRRRGCGGPDRLGARLEVVIRSLVEAGACIERVELGTLADSARRVPLSAAELARVAAPIASTVPVRIAV